MNQQAIEIIVCDHDTSDQFKGYRRKYRYGYLLDELRAFHPLVVLIQGGKGD